MTTLDLLISIGTAVITILGILITISTNSKKVKFVGWVLAIIGVGALVWVLDFQNKKIDDLVVDMKEIQQQLFETKQVDEITDIEVVSRTIVVHTPGVYAASWDKYPSYTALLVPDGPAIYNLTEEGTISCGEEFKPVVAWSETMTSSPDWDVMYTIAVSVVDGDVKLYARGRENRSGYYYVRALVLCRRS